MEHTITLTEYIVRFILSAEAGMLVVLKLIALYFYAKRNAKYLTSAEPSIEKKRAWHTMLVRGGNALVYGLFCLATIFNIGRGVNGWQVAFIVGFAIVFVGVFQMMRYEINAFKYGIHETMV